MKYQVVDWVTGLDEKGRLLRPDFDEYLKNNISQERWNEEYSAADEAVIAAIRENGYRFTGAEYQSAENCMPLLDIGVIYFVTMRHWGRLMYKAWHPCGNDEYGYCRYAFTDFPEDEPHNLPPQSCKYGFAPRAKQDVYTAIEEAEHDIAAGHCRDAFEVLKEVFHMSELINGYPLDKETNLSSHCVDN